MPSPNEVRKQARELLSGCGREPLLEVVHDALFGTAQWVALDAEDITDVAVAMDTVFPRAGALWKAVEADLALVGDWYCELEQSGEPEPVAEVQLAPAFARWIGEDRWDDEGTIEYVGAALSAFANDRIDGALDTRTNDDMLELWASGSALAQIGPRPRQWPPAARKANST